MTDYSALQRIMTDYSGLQCHSYHQLHEMTCHHVKMYFLRINKIDIWHNNNDHREPMS